LKSLSSLSQSGAPKSIVSVKYLATISKYSLLGFVYPSAIIYSAPVYGSVTIKLGSSRKILYITPKYSVYSKWFSKHSFVSVRFFG